MKILLDTSPLLNQHSGRGIGTYTRELYSGLQHIAESNSDLAILAPHANPELQKEKPEIDLIHYPYFDLFFSTLPVHGEVPVVVTVHDVTPLVLSEKYPVGVKGKIRFWQQKRKLQKCEAVITDSQNSRDDIIRYLGISPHKVFVVPLAASADLQPQSEYFVEKHTEALKLPEKYVVYVGDINRNKNLTTLLLALTQVDEDIHLCVVSQTFKNTAIPEGKELADTIKANDLEERVHVLNIPAGNFDVLAAVMQKSRCLVLPSLYEGFGLPVLEAMQVGAVVVCSNTSSLPEVAGDAAILVDPTIAGISQGIERAVRLRGEDRLVWREKGLQRAQSFSWKKTAEQTYAVYEHVFQEWIKKQGKA